MKVEVVVRANEGHAFEPQALDGNVGRMVPMQLGDRGVLMRVPCVAARVHESGTYGYITLDLDGAEFGEGEQPPPAGDYLATGHVDADMHPLDVMRKPMRDFPFTVREPEV